MKTIRDCCVCCKHSIRNAGTGMYHCIICLEKCPGGCFRIQNYVKGSNCGLKCDCGKWEPREPETSFDFTEEEIDEIMRKL